MRMRLAAALTAACVLSGCGTTLLVETHVSPARTQAAEAVRIFRRGEAAPKVARTLVWVEGVSCRSEIWDPVSEKAALLQAKLRALDMGADALVEVQAVTAGTDLEENCWKTVTVSGLAVILAKGG
jgi:hypothetical protein